MNKEQEKERILTELFNSNQLQTIIGGILYHHKLPLEAELKDDILQETFYWLSRKTPDQIINMYKRSPKELVGLGVTIALTKGVYIDKRNLNGKFWTHSIGQSILHGSSIRGIQYDPEIALDEGENDVDIMNKENYNHDMWEYVKENLSNEQKIVLSMMLSQKPPRLVGQYKKAYFKLLPQIKELITEFKQTIKE